MGIYSFDWEALDPAVFEPALNTTTQPAQPLLTSAPPSDLVVVIIHEVPTANPTTSSPTELSTSSTRIPIISPNELAATPTPDIPSATVKISVESIMVEIPVEPTAINIPVEPAAIEIPIESTTVEIHSHCCQIYASSWSVDCQS